MVSKLLIDARKAAGITLSASADLLGVSRETLMLWEIGAEEPSVSQLIGILVLYNEIHENSHAVECWIKVRLNNPLQLRQSGFVIVPD